MILKNIWEKWIIISEIIGNMLSRIILTILYFTLFAIPSIFLTYFVDRFGKKITTPITSYYHNEKIAVNKLEESKEM